MIGPEEPGDPDHKSFSRPLIFPSAEENPGGTQSSAWARATPAAREVAERGLREVIAAERLDDPIMTVWVTESKETQ